MAAATSPQIRRLLEHDAFEVEDADSLRPLPRQVTLLELVEAVSAVASNEQEVIATVISMLTRGRVRLCGNFRDEPPEGFQD